MKQIIIFLTFTMMSVQGFANVNYIDISKISSDPKLVSAFNFLKENTKYYDKWTSKWSHDKPKAVLVRQLHQYFRFFSVLRSKNEETYLLLGDIAHYLYNMDDNAYFNIAITNYETAVKSNPTDYRCYWFLGNHYVFTKNPNFSIEKFKNAEKLLPTEQPADFWNDYATATAVTNMPSHCIYAMDKVKSISGEEGSFQQQLGKAIYRRIVPMDKNESYKKEDIWTASQSDEIAFTSRPLGIKILVDSTWNLEPTDYKKNIGAILMIPPSIANKKGQKITYSVVIFMKTVNDNDKLSDYINNFVSKYSNKKQISFSDKYDKMIAYEIQEKSMYQNLGGGHLYMIGIERNAPKYPGLLLENPATMPKGIPGQVNYYRATDSQDRFKGKMFYLIMLDSCEDIHEQSLAVFKTLFNSQIIIE